MCIRDSCRTAGIVGLRNSAHTVVKMLQPIGGHAPHEALRLVSYTHPEYRDTLTDYFLRHPANVLLARGTEGEAVADARRGSAVEWLHDGTHETVIEAVEGSSDAPPALPAGTDVAATAQWLSLIHISEPTRHVQQSRMPSSA